MASFLWVTSILQISFKLIYCQSTDEEPTVVTVADIQRLGEAKLDNATRSYIASGADREQTLRENPEAFTRLRFRPRMLVDVSNVNTATRLLGLSVSFPVGFSPSAAHKMADPVGEVGTAQAAQDAGTVMILGAWSSTTLEEVRASAPDCLLWQQTYIFANRSLTESLVQRAAAQGFSAIVVTVDSPVGGQVANAEKNKFSLPPGVSFANMEASAPGHSFTFDVNSDDFIGNTHSANVTWKDIKWLCSLSDLPVVVKGVLTPESAWKAYEHGAAAILVSNHGGRQLDGDPATIEVLPDIVAAVGDRMEVYMDGGVRFGSDVVKALCLGARAVFVGRPVFWGLAYKGKEGLDELLNILKDELVRTLKLLGSPDSNDLCPAFVVREEYYSRPRQ